MFASVYDNENEDDCINLKNIKNEKFKLQKKSK